MQNQPFSPSLAGMAVAWATGAGEGLLLARLLARLLAARPDHPFIQVLNALTTPLVFPLRSLDNGQPHFGAVLELSTLTLMLVVLGVGLLLWYAIDGRNRSKRRS
ncbi:MAG: YggT family protein [Chloroflexaceae bacterium]|nr:YggT family protein [Chloroflexaceae bacterium]